MHEKCGDDLYDGKDADLEYNLLHKIIDSIRALVPRLMHPGRKPRHDTGYQIEYKRVIRYRSGLQSYGKYKPVDQDRYDRLDKCPDNTKIGSCIFCLKSFFARLKTSFRFWYSSAGKANIFFILQFLIDSYIPRSFPTSGPCRRK